MAFPPDFQKTRDIEHIRLLSLFYYITGGITALFACIPLIHVAMGVFMAVAGLASGGRCGAPPAIMGCLFAGIGGAIVLVGWVLAAVKILAGYFLQKRKQRVFCLVAAGVSCLSVPYGTVLGVFTFLILLRPSVKELFDGNAEGAQ